MRVGIQPFPASGNLRLDFRFAKMRTTATSCRVLNPGIVSAKTKGHLQVSFCFGGVLAFLYTPDLFLEADFSRYFINDCGINIRINGIAVLNFTDILCVLNYLVYTLIVNVMPAFGSYSTSD